MKEPSVLFRQEGPVGVITLNRPNSHNAVTAEMVSEFQALRAGIGWDSGLSVLLLTAQGPDFCIGTDPEAWRRFPSREEALTYLSLTPIIASFNQPVIAAIAGRAYGQGLELALACDLRLCAEEASFALPQIASGEIPFDGGTQRLPRLIGRLRAMEMILTGKAIGAAEAKDIGLVNGIVPAAELNASAFNLAKELAAKGPIALRYAKEAVLKGLDLTLEQGLRLEADLYFLLHTTQDRREGITAFREKRSPKFEGR